MLKVGCVVFVLVVILVVAIGFFYVSSHKDQWLAAGGQGRGGRARVRRWEERRELRRRIDSAPSRMLWHSLRNGRQDLPRQLLQYCRAFA